MNTTTSAVRSFKRLADPANRLGLVGVGVVIATIAIGIYEAVPVVRAIRVGGVRGQAADGKDAVLQYAAAVKNDASQIDGRSFFFDPPKPPPPYVPPPPAPPEHHEKAGPPPPPSTYGGPKVIGTAFDTVWFDNSKTMRVGGPVEDDMRVLSISTAPYIVKIQWKEVVFDVPFLPRDTIIDKSAAATSTSTDSTPPAPSAAPPSAAAPAAPSAPPAAAGDKKPDDKTEPKKEDKKDEPKPAGDKPPAATPPTPPDKKDGSH